MKFCNKLAATSVLLILTMCVIVPTISAADYSKMETLSEAYFTDHTLKLGILGPVVKISPSQVTVNYTSVSSTTESMLLDLTVIVGAYWGIVHKFPEVGDLLITLEDRKGDALGTLTCQKDWVKGMDDVKNVSAMSDVMQKVVGTW